MRPLSGSILGNAARNDVRFRTFPGRPRIWLPAVVRFVTLIGAGPRAGTGCK